MRVRRAGTHNYRGLFSISLDKADLEKLLNEEIISAQPKDKQIRLMFWPAYDIEMDGTFRQDNDAQVVDSHRNYIMWVDIKKCRTPEELAERIMNVMPKQERNYSNSYTTGYVNLNVEC